MRDRAAVDDQDGLLRDKVELLEEIRTRRIVGKPELMTLTSHGHRNLHRYT